MTNDQTTFDTVARHLLTQGRQARRDINSLSCMYRAPNGDRCAAGCLIPDADYNPQFEGAVVDKPEIAAILKREGHDVNLVYDLQTVHDKTSPILWPAMLRKLADDRELSTNVLDEFPNWQPKGYNS